MKRYSKSSAGHITGRILLKKLAPLFAALLVTSCGEKSSSEGSDSPGGSAEPSADATQESEKPVNVPLLSDADVERLLKEAVDFNSLEVRNDDLFYQGDKPYSGWAKRMYDSGQANFLLRVKDAKVDGPQIGWHETGEKRAEGTWRSGKMDGPWTHWHENGQKLGEVKYKDGELISERYWNSKGEEVGSERAAYGY